MQPGNRAVLVLSMHRGGASALAGVLNLLGVDLGSDVQPIPTATGEVSFEYSRLARLHEWILSDIGSAWHDYHPLPDRWWEHERVRQRAVDLRIHVERQFAQSALWLVKDPRLCRLVPFWRQVLEESGTRMAVIILTRDPREVAASLEQHESLPPWRSQLLYLAHMIAAERDTREHARAFVTFDALLSDWRGAIRRICASLDLPLAEAIEAAGDAVDRFLDPRLRRHRAIEMRGRPDTPLDSLAGRYFRAISSATDLHARKPRSIMDGIAAVVDELVGPLDQVAADYDRRLEWRTREMGEARAAAVQVTREVEEARARIASLEAEIERLRDVDQARAARETELADQLARGTAELDEARQTVTALEGRVESARERQRAVESDAAARNTELRRARDDYERDLARLSAENSRQAESLEAARAARASLAQELDASRTSGEVLLAQLEATRRMLETQQSHETALAHTIQQRNEEIARLREASRAAADEAARSREAVRVLTDQLAREQDFSRTLGDDIAAARDAEAARELSAMNMSRALRDRDEEIAQATTMIDALTLDIERAHELIASLGREIDEARRAAAGRESAESELRAELAAARAREQELRGIAAARTAETANVLLKLDQMEQQLRHLQRVERELRTELHLRGDSERRLTAALDERGRELQALGGSLRRLQQHPAFRLVQKIIAIDLATDPSSPSGGATGDPPGTVPQPTSRGSHDR
jgi:hypothetical protein